jgi:hypothetical protein
VYAVQRLVDAGVVEEVASPGPGRLFLAREVLHVLEAPSLELETADG